MRRVQHVLVGLLALVLLAPTGTAESPVANAAVAQPASHVDPFIGTLGAGFVFPGPAAPFGMVQLSPDTEGQFAYTGYQWIDRFIRGFSHVHISAMGVPAGGNLPFMPTTGEITSTDVEDYQSPFSHAAEEAEPGYYRVHLDRYGVDAELTAGNRVGLHRYTFPPDTRGNVLIDVGRHIPGGSADGPHRIPGTYPAVAQVIPEQRMVVGTANTTAEGPHHYTVHFAARFDQPFTDHGVWESRGSGAVSGPTTVEGDGAGAYVSFDARQVVAEVGISFVSIANAIENLESELADDPGFDGLRQRTYDAWNDALSSITVEGGGPTDLRVFYSMLYRTMHHPNVFNDVNGDYRGHDGEVHRIGAEGDPMPEGTTYRANFSLWDTMRGQMQLLGLIRPEDHLDAMYSLGAIAHWGGRLPRWAMMDRYPDFMGGEPSLPVVADAACRGLVPYELAERLYQAGRVLALEDHREPPYLELGYVPHEHSSRSASSSLEHPYHEFALALLADGLGHGEDRDALLEQAGNWRNVFDDGTAYVRPRHRDGSWVEPYHPWSDIGFQEGTGAQYTWLVPHDVRGLFDAIGAHPRGGDEEVVHRLDEFFLTPVTTTVPLITPEAQQKITLYGIAYAGNQYPPSNQHVLHAPYLYNWIGQPWKTQGLARAYQGLYRPVPDGLPGNDDLGTLSSWYVWSALGFYPGTYGAPLFTIGSPRFERVTVRLDAEESFTISAPGASETGRYVQSASLNGGDLERTWFTHRDLIDGGELRLEMGPTENREWATARGQAPPSMSTHDLAEFACDPPDPPDGGGGDGGDDSELSCPPRRSTLPDEPAGSCSRRADRVGPEGLILVR